MLAEALGQDKLRGDRETQSPAAPLSISEAGSRAVARLRGPFDRSRGDALLDCVRTLCRKPKRVVLDLRGADYIDSDGVRALLRLGADAEALQSDLRLVLLPSGKVERTLAMLQVLGSFSTSATVAQAWRGR